DLRQGLDRPVELARTEPVTVPVQRRVAAPVDDRAAARRDAQPVAVTPDAGIGVEVALEIAPVVRVVPEVERHRGHRLLADQLADLVDEAAPVLVPGLDVGAEA